MLTALGVAIIFMEVIPRKPRGMENLRSVEGSCPWRCFAAGHLYQWLVPSPPWNLWVAMWNAAYNCASWGQECGHLPTNCLCYVLCSYPLPWAICSPALRCDSGRVCILVGDTRGQFVSLLYPQVLGLWPLPYSKSGSSFNFRVGNAYGNLTLTSPCLRDRRSGSGWVDSSLLNCLCGRRGISSVLPTEEQGAPFSVFLWWSLFPFLGKEFF